MSNVVPFPDRSRMQGRLVARDVTELRAWNAARQCSSDCIAVIHPGAGGEDPCDADLVLIYGAGTKWAEWGLARQAGGITLWHCAAGTDHGLFSTMDEALAALQRRCRCPRHALPAVPVSRRDARNRPEPGCPTPPGR